MERFKRLGIAALTVGTLTATALAGIAPRTRPAQPAAAPAVAHLVAFGGRGHSTNPATGKLDSMLADIVRHAGRVRAGSALADLRALNPAARFQVTATAGPMVLIDAVTRGDPQRLKAALMSLGLQNASVFSNDVGGWMPVSRLTAAAARTEVHAMRAALPRARTGSVTSSGDYVQGSAALRLLWPGLDGKGVTVGVLSDSFDCYAIYAQPGSGVPAAGPSGYASNGFTADAAKDVSTGDLPSGVTVLAEAGDVSGQTCMDFNGGLPTPELLPYSDEGRAMLQVVHDVAPGAGLAFHTAVETQANFADGIIALAASGAKVIADDIGYFEEPFFQPSLIEQAIDQVNGQGVAYFVAAGNDGQLSYDNLGPSFATPSSAPNPAGEMLLTFGTSGGSAVTTLPVTIAPALSGVTSGGLVPGEFVALVVEWDQPYVTGAPASGGATSQLDLCVTGSGGGDIITDIDLNSTSCTGPNTLGGDPVLIMLVGNPASNPNNTGPETINITLGLVNGSPAPGRIKLAVLDNGAGSTINQFFTPGSTVQGHARSTGAMSMGAAFWANTPACGVTPAQPESFSSAGGDPNLFDAAGNPLATPVDPQKPDLIAPDGGNNTFLGFKITGTQVTGFPQCVNDPNLPSFFGTSAATPHAAGVAALMLQANPAVTVAQVYKALKDSADPMIGSPAAQVGAGFIQAQAALALLQPAAPTLTLSAGTVSPGQATTLTWSSINTTGCTASGSWSGAQNSSGTMTVMQANSGSYTYTLMCTNAAGTSAATSATLQVMSPAPSGGGGLDALTLGALASWLAARLAAQRRERREQRLAAR
ncbi:MAG TPA: S8 family serine peptidase [Steroidobacteraceae bacterium]|nr:S8 family serine peptidase [Steroidobacteraceae bacterium]